MLLHEYFIKIREEHHLTRKNLAEIMNCSVSNYNSFERGEHCPKYIRLVFLARYLNISVGVFYPMYIKSKYEKEKSKR